jgi:hypothetical protein
MRPVGDQTVATLPLEWFSREVGRSTDGFLGSNIFRNYVVEIDYANQLLRLHDPSGYSYSGSGQRLPLQFIWDNIPSVHAGVVAQDGTVVSGVFLIDSGATTALWLTKAFSNAHPEFLSAQETLEVPMVVAVGGELSARVGRVPAVRAVRLAGRHLRLHPERDVAARRFECLADVPAHWLEPQLGVHHLD